MTNLGDKYQTLTYPECIEGFVKYGDGPHMWQILTHMWQYPSPYLTNPSIHSGYVKVWGWTPYVTNPNPYVTIPVPIFDKSLYTLRVRQSLRMDPVCDKSQPICDRSQPHIWQMENFRKGDPLLLIKWWNRAMWLVEGTSHDRFPGLSLAKSIACSFLCPLGV